MSLVVVTDQGKEDEALRQSAEWCVRRYAEPAENLNPGETIPAGKHVNLLLEASGRKSFMLEIESHAQLGLYTQHTAEEFDIKLIREENKQEIPFEVERTWVAQHEHDDEVGSIAIERDGDVDNEKLNKWLGKLLSERGVDIFRMKGLSLIHI